LTAQSALEFGLIDEIIPEPKGGAHRRTSDAINTVRDAITQHYQELKDVQGKDLKEQRYQKFRAMGIFITA
jgi:acetyl-CoA carboxylase carboxyl transferase subunit alpha